MVNADRQFAADVLLEGGLIAAVGLGLKAPPGARVLNATGLLVMPGGIDPHTHLDMPFMGAVTVDDFASGHAAALAGGTTMCAAAHAHKLRHAVLTTRPRAPARCAGTLTLCCRWRTTCWRGWRRGRPRRRAGAWTTAFTWL